MVGLPRHEYKSMPPVPGDLAPMLRFDDIQVVPTQGVAKHIATGGPIWPDFDRQTEARHCRDRRPEDHPPRAARRSQNAPGPAVWGGLLNPHFGHLIIEQLTRLPQSLRDRPDDPVLFILMPGMETADIPKHVLQLLDWYGVPPQRRHYVTTPLTVKTLHVAPQPEMMGHVHPVGAYLDLLNLAMARNDLQPRVRDIVYVGRPGYVAQGQGGLIGEAYLSDRLAAAGVTVIDPLRHSVREQMEIYAGARVLMFSEGSAMLGRHVLGYLPQEIHVLRRRPGRDLCSFQLGPRCARLVYHPVVGHRLGAEMPGGGHHHNLTAGLLDLEVVFETFAALGVDLARDWNMQEYQAVVAQDARGWMENCHTAPEQVLRNLDRLRSLGVDIDQAPGFAAKMH